MSAAEIFSKLLFDAPQGTAAPCQIVNDDVMGGLSISTLQIGALAAVFQGELSRRNNGGFASVRLVINAPDLTSCDAFRLTLRGDGRRYRFTVRTTDNPDGVIYQCGLDTRSGEWETHLIPFQRFVASYRGRAVPEAVPLDPAKVSALGFLISDQQEGPFRLEIARLEGCAWKLENPPA